MLKKLKMGFLLALTVLVSFLIYKIVEKAKIKKQAKENTLVLPDFEFHTLDGSIFNNNMLKKDMPVVFILFNSECSYCQYEAEEIEKNIARFKNIQLLMISEELPEPVKEFSETYNLNKFQNVSVLTDSKQEFLTTFGTNVVPVVFIYNKHHKLVKQYKGETKIDAILKAANSTEV